MKSIFKIIWKEKFFLVGTFLLVLSWYLQNISIENQKRELDDLISKEKKLDLALLDARVSLTYMNLLLKSNNVTLNDSLNSIGMYVGSIMEARKYLFQLRSDSVDVADANIISNFTIHSVRQMIDNKQIKSLVELRNTADKLFDEKLINLIYNSEETMREEINRKFDKNYSCNIVLIIIGSVLIAIDKSRKYFIKKPIVIEEGL